MSCESDCDVIYFDVIEFLAEYEKLPVLWDREHVAYKDWRKREQCKEILSEKLGIFDMNTLRKKIRSIRGSYNTEIRKIKLSMDSGDEVYIPKLSWFPVADSFLRGTTDLSYEEFPLIELAEMPTPKKRLIPKKPKSTNVSLLQVPRSKHKEKSQDTKQCDSEEYEEFEYLENTEDDTDAKPIMLDNLDMEQIEYSESKSLLEQPRKKHRTSSLIEVVDYLKSIASTSENEFAAFGKSVGLQLQNMPLDLAVQLQMDIQAHITKARLDFLQQTNMNNNNSDKC